MTKRKKIPGTAQLAPGAALAVSMFAAMALPADAQQATPAEMFQKECSACHMAFQPMLLPARSWQAIMGDLSNHFGEDASLDDQSRDAIAAWLEANAGPDNARIGSAPDGGPILRITETNWWKREHRPGEVNPAAFDHPRVGSKANCMACHRGADKGIYEDD